MHTFCILTLKVKTIADKYTFYEAILEVMVQRLYGRIRVCIELWIREIVLPLL